MASKRAQKKETKREQKGASKDTSTKPKKPRKPSYQVQFDQIRAALKSGEITSLEEFNERLDKIVPSKGSLKFDDKKKELEEYAKQVLGIKEEEQEAAQTEAAPEVSTESTEVVPDVSEGQAEAVPEETVKNEAPVEETAEETLVEETTENPTQNAPEEVVEESAGEPSPEKEEPKLDKYERKVKNAEEAARKAEADLKAARTTLSDLESERSIEESNIKRIKEQLEKGTSEGKITPEQLLAQARKYDEIRKKVEAQIRVVGKYAEILSKAQRLSSSMAAFRDTYSTIKTQNEALKTETDEKKDNLTEREGRKESSFFQKLRLSSSRSKIGRMTLKGALKKDLTVAPLVKISYVYRKLGLDKKASEIEAKAGEKAGKINAAVSKKIEEEYAKRGAVEDKVDVINSVARKIMDDRKDVFTSKTSTLKEWKEKSVNGTSPFKKAIAAVAAGRETAAQRRALRKVSRAVGRAKRNLERKIAKGEMEKLTPEQLEEKLAHYTEQAIDTHRIKSDNGSKVYKFVDEGNQIREVLEERRKTAREDAKKAFDAKQQEIDDLNKNDEEKTEGALFGTKRAIHSAQKGRQRRLNNLRSRYEGKGFIRRTAANMAAFLRLEGKAQEHLGKEIDIKKEYVNDKMGKVVPGSRLGQIASKAGEDALNAPQIVSKATADFTRAKAQEAKDFVEKVRMDSATKAFDASYQKGLALHEQVEQALGKTTHEEAQHVVESQEHNQNTNEGEEIGG
ncbi:MAG: hypothetical protein IKN74_05450 [Clostridia bacterium]|nr:hypothetical protein [Clostridia bacterium]